MKILGFAAAPQDVEMPPEGAGRRARLPSVAVALAKLAAGRRALPRDTAVFFGTGYGAATETEAFVENMFRHGEETPKPRAFSASVHNAMASQVAMALGAKGACRTFVHGELSFLAAMRSAHGYPFSIVGSLDESTPYIRRGRAACERDPGGEGGAVFVCGDQADGLAEVRFHGHAAVTVRVPDDHPSMSAVVAAKAVGILCGKLEPGALDLTERPESIAIAVRSRFRERDSLILERAC